jgi:hypothetical protein
MSPETLLPFARQLLIKGIEKERFELIALQTVVGFTWHHITCL